MKSREISGQISFDEYLAGIQQEKAEAPVRAREPKMQARLPTLPEDIKTALLGGAGRPGARFHIMEAVQTGEAYAPIRAAVEELAGAESGGVLFLRRGIRSRDGRMYSWPLAMAFAADVITSGKWIPEAEEALERDAFRNRKRRKGWNL